MLYRYRFPFQRGIGLLIFIPMVMPEVLMGVSLLAEFVHLLKLPLGHVTLIIAHTTFCFPFVLVGIQARLQGLDPFLEEAALDLGATPAQAFRLVIVPYLMPSIISGALIIRKECGAAGSVNIVPNWHDRKRNATPFKK